MSLFCLLQSHFYSPLRLGMILLRTFLGDFEDYSEETSELLISFFLNETQDFK